MDFCDIFWPCVTLTFHLLISKVNRFMPLLRGPLVPIVYSFKYSELKSLATDEQINRQKNEWTG